MALVYSTLALDTFSPTIYYGTIESSSTSHIKYSDGVQASYFGGYFTFSSGDLVEGGITVFWTSLNGVSTIHVERINLDALTFFDYLEVGDTEGAYSYVFGGADYFYGSTGNDQTRGYSGSDSIGGAIGDDLLQGDGGNDSLFGNEGADTLSGGTGHDHLYGGAGSDTLIGGRGNDDLSGGGRGDRLTGGEGADSYTFIEAIRPRVDRITDFNVADDVIRLSSLVPFTALDIGDLAHAAFHSGPGATAAHDTDDRIVYDTDNGRLYYDSDGVGGAEAVLFAILSGKPAITEADFVVF